LVVAQADIQGGRHGVGRGEAVKALHDVRARACLSSMSQMAFSRAMSVAPVYLAYLMTMLSLTEWAGWRDHLP
jgi:hypothetical protein